MIGLLCCYLVVSLIFWLVHLYIVKERPLRRPFLDFFWRTWLSLLGFFIEGLIAALEWGSGRLRRILGVW